MLDYKKFYINGQWVDPVKKNDFEVINPSDESVCAIISLGSQADTDAAVSAAKAAFPMWSSSTKEDRIELLEKLYDIIKEEWMKWLRLYLWKWVRLSILQKDLRLQVELKL